MRTWIRNKSLKVISPAVFIVMLTGISLGQDIEPIEMPTMPDPASKVEVPTVGVPSMGDLMTVVDKATTNEGQGKDWSTPVKLVIIFSGLAIIPSLLVMMTSFTRIVIVLAFVQHTWALRRYRRRSPYSAWPCS